MAQQSAEAPVWVILPAEVHAYLAPSLDAPRDERTLGYPETIQERRRAAPGETPAGKTEWIEFRDGEQMVFLPAAQLARKMPLPRGGRNLPIGEELVDREAPLPLEYVPDDLAALPAQWIYAKDGKVELRAEAARMAEKMFEGAKRDKIDLRAVSGYRSAETQRRLYLKKIEEAGPDQGVVAKPGHSEHQLGTALDVSGLDPKTVLVESFGDTFEGRWLRDNAAQYGFRLSYTGENSRRTGYEAEPWHLRYVGPSSSKTRKPPRPELP